MNGMKKLESSGPGLTVSTGWALALGLGLICSVLALSLTPLKTLPLSYTNDALNHCDYIASAAEAINEGQWFIREIPRINSNEEQPYRRYALYQFYSVVPYTLGGLLVKTGMTPYAALVALVGLSFWLGFLGIFCLSGRWVVSTPARLAGSVVYTLAPYHLSDWYSRFALPEIAAFGILPWIFWAGLKASKGERFGVGLSALLWAVLILTHNIFHAWGLVFFILLLVRTSARERGGRTGLWRVAGAYGLGLACAAAYMAPVLLVGRHFGLAGWIDPHTCSAFTPFKVLFSPVYTQADSKAKLLCLQVGWLLLAAAFLALRRMGRFFYRDGLLLGFILAVFLAWCPWDVWRFMGPLRVIQFPYRLLLFSTLFGSLLAARAYERLKSGWRAWGLPVLMAAVGCWYLAPFLGLPLTALTPEKQMLEQARGGTPIRLPVLMRYAFHYLPEALKAFPETRPEKAGFKMRRVGNGPMVMTSGKFPAFASLAWGRTTRVEIKGAGPDSVALLPSPWYPGMYRVWVNGRKEEPGRFTGWLAIRLNPGDSVIEYRLTGMGWANVVSVFGCLILVMLLLVSLVNVRKLKGIV